MLDFLIKEKSLIFEYPQVAHTGVKGVVAGEAGVGQGGAAVTVLGREKPVLYSFGLPVASSVQVVTSARGEYWRPLLPGKYTLQAEHRNQYGLLRSQPEQ